LLSILPDDRGRRFETDPDATSLVDIGTLGGNPPNNVFSCQNRCHYVAKLRRAAFDGGILRSNTACFASMIPEIDIWRATTVEASRRAA
jgi:hypothetical protein